MSHCRGAKESFSCMFASGLCTHRAEMALLGQVYEGFKPGAVWSEWSKCEQWKSSSEIQN